MTWIVSWLIGSKVGRWVALGLLIVALCGVLAWLLMAKGAAAERTKSQAAAAAATINVLIEKTQTDEEIRALSPAARRQRLRDYADGANRERVLRQDGSGSGVAR